MTTIGHFSLYGDFELSDITAALGLEPSDVFRKGETLEGADCPMTISTWDVHCPVDQAPSEQVAYLLNLLEPRAAVLESLAKRFTAEMNITGEGVQTLELKPETLRKLASFGVGLNYFFSPEGVEDGD